MPEKTTELKLGKRMRISLILAVSRNGVIGRDGSIPWRISTDMRRFRSLTMGKPIIMGRKQYDTVGKPLEGRDNIVVTRNAAFAAPGILVVPHLDAALELAAKLARQRGADEIMVIGGAQIYALALPRADRIYLSRVAADVDGDVRFDIADTSGWQVVSKEEIPAGPKDQFGHVFCVLDRIPP
jgi:dihydrofolate reductase